MIVPQIDYKDGRVTLLTAQRWRDESVYGPTAYETLQLGGQLKREGLAIRPSRSTWKYAASIVGAGPALWAARALLAGKGRETESI